MPGYVTQLLGGLNCVANDSRWRILAVGQLIRNRPREYVTFQNGSGSGDLLAYTHEPSAVWPVSMLVRGTSAADLEANVASVYATLASAVAYQTTLSGSPVDYVQQRGDAGTQTWEIVRYENYSENWVEEGFGRCYLTFDLVVTQQ